MSAANSDYDDFFGLAFTDEGKERQQPFDYQRRLALDPELYSLINVPTGAGKTNAILGAWLWRRLTRPDTVGRRLVYCLPMRTLVEQTRGVAEEAIGRLGLKERFTAYVLMGGDVDNEWEAQPERECLFIGTQEMLLSRALNRGYAMSRFKWPVHYGLLNNDCLWVFDEVQLMSDGLATSTQLAAFRELFKTFGHSHSIWMSATLDRNWLKTIDFAPRIDGLPKLELSDADRAAPLFKKRLTAVKTLERAPASCRVPEGLAEFIKEHHTPGTQTLVVVNRVARARETFVALEERYGLAIANNKKKGALSPPDSNAPEIKLIHSRFRPHERKEWMRMLNAEPGGNGRIIVATQVVEAGVDISSRLLITDLAPYASLVQRFGRSNRAGEIGEAKIYWVDRPLAEKDAKLADKSELDDKEKEKIARPYEWRDLETGSELLAEMQSAAPADLPQHYDPYQPAHVLRRRDLVDLFDTTPDLSGYDLDISRFVRGGDERDVSVAWRALNGGEPMRETPRPTRDELCSVSISEFKDFLKAKDISGKRRQAWLWNALDGRWQKASEDEMRPGLTMLLDASAGGYDVRRGWDASAKFAVTVVPEAPGEQNEALDDDPLTWRKYAQTLAAHSSEARAAAEEIIHSLKELGLDEWSADLIFATHYHDLGKAHHVFQATLQGSPPETTLQTPWLAKSTRGGRHARPHFRHELASALALLQMGKSDLAVYLAACHHGKVRLSIRALSGEKKPDDPNKKFARGIWEGDTLPAMDLGGGELIAEMKLDLEPMLLGANANGSRSWLECMIALRDRVGVFRLAFLESLIRAADVRASANPKEVL
jgi:CRISPR-associated endonuclease/helicase Cas3